MVEIKCLPLHLIILEFIMKKSSKVRIYTIDGIKYMVKMTKLKYVEAFSDETNCFTGILQIKTPTKTYSLECSNRGCGAETDVDCYGENKEIFEILNNYLKKFKNVAFIDIMKRIYNVEVDEANYYYYMSVVSLVDELVDECIYG